MTNVTNDKTSYTANLFYRTFEFLLVTWDSVRNNIYITATSTFIHSSSVSLSLEYSLLFDNCMGCKVCSKS